MHKGYQTVLPSFNATFPPCLYFPRRARSPLKEGSHQQGLYPFDTINSLQLLPAAAVGPPSPRTRGNEVMVFSGKFGNCPLQTGRLKKVVTGLESLPDAHFTCNYILGDVLVFKSTSSDQPSAEVPPLILWRRVLTRSGTSTLWVQPKLILSMGITLTPPHNVHVYLQFFGFRSLLWTCISYAIFRASREVVIQNFRYRSKIGRAHV